MELQDSLTVERYRVAVTQQGYFTGVARDAFATYAKFVAGAAGIVIVLLAARESFGLDKALMPDLLSVIAYLQAFLAIVAVVQIAIALVRWRRARAVAAGINPDTPKLHPAWWFSEMLYIVVIIVSVAFGWRVLGALARSYFPAP